LKEGIARFWDFLLGYPKIMKFKDLQGSFTWEKFFLTILIYFYKFTSKMMFLYKLQEVFSELRIRVSLENGFGRFQAYLILQIWDTPELLKRFQKQF
jgi:hypothetical protein